MGPRDDDWFDNIRYELPHSLWNPPDWAINQVGCNPNGDRKLRSRVPPRYKSGPVAKGITAQAAKRQKFDA